MSSQSNFIANVKKFLGERTPYWLAKETGMAQSTIHSLVKGTYQPSLETVDKISEAFDVTPMDLISPPLKKSAVPPDILKMLEGQAESSYHTIRVFLKTFPKKTK